MEKNNPPDDVAVASVDPTKSEAGIDLHNIVIALLFSADEPLSVRKMSSVIETATVEEIKASVDKWRRRFEDEAWSIRVEMVGGGYQISSHPDYSAFIARLYSGKRKFRLSRAGLEVLAIVGYKQPVTRAEIECIRGVGSGGVVTNLMERSLIKIVGKARVLGAPFLYGTTLDFLTYLGLSSIKDLPSMEELEALLAKEAYPESALEEEAPHMIVDMDDAESEESEEKDRVDEETEDDVSTDDDVIEIDEIEVEVNVPLDEEVVPAKEPVAASAQMGSFSGAAAPAESEAEYDTDPPTREEDVETSDEQAKSTDDSN